MTTATFFKGDDEVLIVNGIILQDTKFCQHVNLPVMHCRLVSRLWCPLVFFLCAQTIVKRFLKASYYYVFVLFIYLGFLSVFIPFCPMNVKIAAESSINHNHLGSLTAMIM